MLKVQCWYSQQTFDMLKKSYRFRLKTGINKEENTEKLEEKTRTGLHSRYKQYNIRFRVM